MRWTREQERILAEFANKGAAEIRAQLFVQTGALVSASAIVNKASRLGISLVTEEPHGICVRCGAIRKERDINDEGLCRTCQLRSMAERQRRENERIRKEARRNEESDAAAAREYATARKQLSRTRGEHVEVRRAARSEQESLF